MHFKIRPATRCGKLFDAYCAKKQLARDHVRFLFDGNPIDILDTPAILEMKDGDSIDALMTQVGD